MGWETACLKGKAALKGDEEEFRESVLFILAEMEQGYNPFRFRWARRRLLELGLKDAEALKNCLTQAAEIPQDFEKYFRELWKIITLIASMRRRSAAFRRREAQHTDAWVPYGSKAGIIEAPCGRRLRDCVTVQWWFGVLQNELGGTYPMRRPRECILRCLDSENYRICLDAAARMNWTGWRFIGEKGRRKDGDMQG